jgi:hypothetical protein
MSEAASVPYSETKSPPAVIYAVMLTRRDPSLGDRVGSIVADE